MARALRAKRSRRRNAKPALPPESPAFRHTDDQVTGYDFLATWIGGIVGNDANNDAHAVIDAADKPAAQRIAAPIQAPNGQTLTADDAAPVWRLARLSRADIEKLIDQSPHGATLPPAVRQEIVDRADGVPLFATELARLYATSDAECSTIDMLLRPGALNAALFARLHELGPLRPLAQVAAILGRDCDVNLLAIILRMSCAQLMPGLAGLRAVEFLRASEDRATFHFSHGLLRDAAYASIAIARRRDLHRQVAEAMAELEADDHRYSPAVIAEHFTAAGDPRAAFKWWHKAGQRAAELSHPRQAVDHLQRALEARARDPDIGSIPEEVEIRRLLGMQYAILKGNGAPDVIDALQRCLDLSNQLPRSPSDFDTLWVLHSCYLVRGDISRALDIGERLIAMVDRDGSEERRMRAHRMQGLAKLLAGRLDDAFAHYHVVLGLYDEKRHADLRFEHASDQGALAYAHLAWGSAIASRAEASEDYANAALMLAGRLQHPHTSAHVICVLAARAQTLGERQTASALAFAGKALSERHGFPYWVAWADLIIGWAQSGPLQNGIAMIERAIKAYRRTGAAQAIPYAYLLLGDAALGSRAPRRALLAFDEGWTLAKRQGLALYGSELLRMRAVAQQTLGNRPIEVAATVEQAYALAQHQGAATFVQRASKLLDKFHSASPDLNFIAAI